MFNIIYSKDLRDRKYKSVNATFSIKTDDGFEVRDITTHTYQGKTQVVFPGDFKNGKRSDYPSIPKNEARTKIELAIIAADAALIAK